MKILLNVLESVETVPTEKSVGWWIGMAIIIAILLVPWIYLLVYALVVQYRVRLFSDGVLVATYRFKAKQPLDQIKLPTKEGYQVEGLYRDEEFKLALEYNTMPKQNLKLYIKWIKEDTEE